MNIINKNDNPMNGIKIYKMYLFLPISMILYSHVEVQNEILILYVKT